MTAMRLSIMATLNVLCLGLAAGGMLLQIMGGSDLYPSPTGPIVLAATAVLVAFGPKRWTRWLGIGVPLVLGLGAAVAAAMTGRFIDQLTTTGEAALLLGSWMHVLGLVGAVISGIGAAAEPSQAATVER